MKTFTAVTAGVTLTMVGLSVAGYLITKAVLERRSGGIITASAAPSCFSTTA
ncbi:hypothetical protein ACIRD2_33340 [Streptomyces sp. NPDC093595]|uniref:hypothetical protein n=1 Tax=Streptomyces sp. NPDC093595 TaxID=3366045 RepID=UPI003822A03E